MQAIDIIEIQCPFDAHVHLRQPGQLLELVVHHIIGGGMQSAYVMPNTVPPLTTVEMAIEYLGTLQRLAPEVQFFVSLYLSPSLTPDEVRTAKACGITGIKSYPRGVTTNSFEGVESYEQYYDVFEVMQELDLVLNLHGEIPSTETGTTCVWNAESRFLPQLVELHQQFPKLRIILEHATTREAVETVKACGPTVGCTITAHHLSLTVDDWAGNGLHYCKPVAKSPDDREALREVIRSGHPRFFLGSDSAPHPLHKKLPSETDCCCAAGIYTSAFLLPTLASIFETAAPALMATELDKGRRVISPIPLERLPNFASNFGRAFYKLPNPFEHMITRLVRSPSAIIPGTFTYTPPGTHENETPSDQHHHIIVPFWAGRNIGWKIESTRYIKVID